MSEPPRTPRSSGSRYILHIVPREVIEPVPAPPGKVTIVEMPSKILVYDTAFNEIGSFLIGA